MTLLSLTFLIWATGVASSLLPRDPAIHPSVSDLLADCPGASPGHADACTFVPDGPVKTVYSYSSSDVVSNCGSGSKYQQKSFGFSRLALPAFSLGSQAAVEGDTIPSNARIDNEGAYPHDTTAAQIVTVDAPVFPNKQAILLIQQRYARHLGRLRVNYGKRVDGHYIWFVSGINNDVPNDDPQHAIRDFDCGSDVNRIVASYNSDPYQRRLT